MKKLIIILFFMLCIPEFISAQMNYEPVWKNIYNFLEDMSIKGIVKYNDEIKPLSRTYIAQNLLKIKSNSNRLTSIEIDELEFYFKEYYDEINKEINHQNITNNNEKDSLTLLGDNSRKDLLRFGKTDRLRFFSYHDSLFTLNIDPILGYSFERQQNETLIHRWNGASLFGSVTDYIGFNLSFRDNLEDGKNIDRLKKLTKVPGVHILKNNKTSIEYDEVMANISYNWSWGSVTFGKDYQIWGSGKRGQLILSDKAPPFPFFRLDISPVDWLRFTYYHGWLQSRIIDTSTIRPGLVVGREAYEQIGKFIAAHMVSFDIYNNLTLSLGESIVYSDRLEPIYFMPVMFFRLADHDLGNNNSNTGGNAQMFGNLYYNISSIKSKLYASLFIDEISIESLLKGGNLSAVGYTFGWKAVDPIVKNSSILCEYTRINPFVYMNSDPTQLYTNHGYQLGHWVGSNGYNVFISYKQKFIRGLELSIFGELVKKGCKELPEEQYKQPYPSFLYGAKYTEKNMGLEISYEYIHDLFAKFSYKYLDVTDEDKTRTLSYMLGKHHSFGISLNYGM